MRIEDTMFPSYAGCRGLTYSSEMPCTYCWQIKGILGLTQLPSSICSGTHQNIKFLTLPFGSVLIALTALTINHHDTKY